MIRDLKFGQQKLPDYVENNEEHEGKVRSFAHERGNWATYVYINCKIIRQLSTSKLYQYVLI